VKPLDFLESSSRATVLTAAIALTGAIGLADYATGVEISFSVFYLIPVSLVSWHIGSRAGMFFSLAAAAVWLAADRLTGPEPSYPEIPYWNAVSRLAIFAFVTSILTALRQTLERERALARTDFLTGLPNARSFDALLDTEIQRARRYRHPLSVAYIDIDNFKVVNDTWGHDAGDALLQALASSMKARVRSTDLIARLGGDEFAIVIPETGEEAASAVVRKIQATAGEVGRKLGWEITMSIGILTCVAAPGSVQELMKMADNLMYEVKRGGKNAIKQRVLADPAGAPAAARE
jgi:diguanylate cyclase (GGDEF)-like protein